MTQPYHELIAGYSAQDIQLIANSSNRLAARPASPNCNGYRSPWVIMLGNPKMSYSLMPFTL